jgi:uncharacterized protein (TIGR02996 family)
MFSETEIALLDAIHTAPRETTPRLAYADWLEEHGQADYAELTRLSLIVRNEVFRESLPWEIRYANWRIGVDGPRMSRLDPLAGPWALPLPSFATSAEFDRGVFLVDIPNDIAPADCLREIRVPARESATCSRCVTARRPR